MINVCEQRFLCCAINSTIGWIGGELSFLRSYGSVDACLDSAFGEVELRSPLYSNEVSTKIAVCYRTAVVIDL